MILFASTFTSAILLPSGSDDFLVVPRRLFAVFRADNRIMNGGKGLDRPP